MPLGAAIQRKKYIEASILFLKVMLLRKTCGALPHQFLSATLSTLQADFHEPIRAKVTLTPVMVNCNVTPWLGHGMPVILLSIISGCVCEGFSEETGTWIDGRCPSQGEWASYSVWRLRKIGCTLSAWSCKLEHPSPPALSILQPSDPHWNLCHQPLRLSGLQTTPLALLSL